MGGRGLWDSSSAHAWEPVLHAYVLMPRVHPGGRQASCAWWWCNLPVMLLFAPPFPACHAQVPDDVLADAEAQAKASLEESDMED